MNLCFRILLSILAVVCLSACGGGSTGDIPASDKTYTVTGTVLGNSASVTLKNNNGDAKTVVTSGGQFTFTAQNYGTNFNVTASSPTGQTCSVLNGSGTVTSNVTNVQVNCTTNTYTISGTVNGNTGLVTLINKNGEIQAVNSGGGNFTFVAQDYGTTYNVAASSPKGQACSVSNGSGTLTDNVTNISVVCSDLTFILGGSVTGLTSNGLSLQLAGSSSDSVTLVNGVSSFIFAKKIKSGGSYFVTILAQPLDQTCTLSNFSGSINSDVSNVSVLCTLNTYTVTGTVLGNSASVTLKNNNGDAKTVVTSGGQFTFTAQNYGTNFNVTASSPTGQTCSVFNASGQISGPVTNVSVICTNNTFTIGGSISGLSASGLTLFLSGSQTEYKTPISGALSYAFTTSLINSENYRVSITEQPTGQTCSLVNSTGTINLTNIFNVNVTCTASNPNSTGNDPIYNVSTFAGSGAAAFADGNGTSASFNNPYGVAIDSAGNIYVADLNNNRIRKISATGSVVTLAGSGIGASSDGIGISASFYGPSGVVTDGSGSVYVADSGNNLIRKITSTGVVSTVAGKAGISGSQDGISTAASFNSPRALTLDNTGNLYVSDGGNNLIRKISSTGLVSTIAGSVLAGSADGVGTNASFDHPRGITLDSANNLFIADMWNHVVRKISQTGTVSTPWSQASVSLDNPTGVAITGVGDIFVANYGNHTIKRIKPSGDSIVIAGKVGVTGNLNGLGTNATFKSPYGIAVDSTGNIYVGDSGNNLIRKLSPMPTYTVKAIISGNTGSVTLTNTTNNGTETKIVASNGGEITFTPNINGTPYSVLSTSPTGQSCQVSKGSGTINAANISNVTVICTTATYTIGGSIAGLGAGKTITLRNNGTDDLTISANQSFTFSKALKVGSAYSVSLATQPIGQNCSITYESGVVSALVTNIAINCTTKAFTVGGTVTGLTDTLVINNNGVDTKTITSKETAFTFANTLNSGSAYVVTIGTQPAGQTCLVINSSGVLLETNVSNVMVFCSGDTYTLSITVQYQVPGSVTSSSSPPDWNNPVTSPVPYVYIELQNSSGDIVDYGYADSLGAVTFYNLNPKIRYTPIIKSKSRNANGFELAVVDNTLPVSVNANKVSTRYKPYEVIASDFIPSDKRAFQDYAVTLKTGWNGAALVDADRDSAPFAILDMVNKVENLGYQATVTSGISAIASPPLYIMWSTSNKGGSTSFTNDFDGGLVNDSGGFFTTPYKSIDTTGKSTGSYVSENIIYLSGDPAFEMMEFGGVVAAHEAFHFIEFSRTRSYSTGGRHSSTEYNDISLVFNEGFADGVPLLVNENKFLSRPRLSQGQIISGARDYSIQAPQSPLGWFQEFTVARMIWSLYDPIGSFNLSKSKILAPIFSTAWQTGAWTPNIWAYGKVLKDQNATLSGAIDSLGRSLNVTFANNDEWGSSEAILGNRTQAQTFSLFTPISPGQSKQICSVGNANEYNKLGNRRWLRFLGDGKAHTITVSGPTNSVPYIRVRNTSKTGNDFTFDDPQYSAGLNTISFPGVFPATEFVGFVGECSVIISEDQARTSSTCQNPAPAPTETCWTITVSP